VLVLEAAKVDVVRSVVDVVIATARMAKIDIVLAVTFIATSYEINHLCEVCSTTLQLSSQPFYHISDKQLFILDLTN